ncbi:hypothetical protein DFJ74DRAFT_759980 [Hyaloraphidium curvatum]|nr:hypothetical protein DFJ74DRAFT_759980 [Hyaloraphidium curvatum]
MRLRQIALITRDLEGTLKLLDAALGFRLAFRDPAVAAFGLVNGVMSAGGEFVEVLQPMPGKNDTTGARWLARNGGDATGYMLIFHAADGAAGVAHMKANGVKVAFEGGTKGYHGWHLHPAGIPGGVLPSVDWMAGVRDPDREPLGGWAYAHAPPYPPASEPGWVALAKESGETVKIVGVTLALSKQEPREAAARWSLLFRAPLEDENGVPAVRFSNAVVRFVRSKDANDGIRVVDILSPDPAAALARAAAAGAPVAHGETKIGGIAWRFVSEAQTAVSREGGWIGKGGMEQGKSSKL